MPRFVALILLLAPLALLATAQDLVTQIALALAAAETCDDCHALLGLMQELAQAGNATFTAGLVGICQEGHLADADVCAGAVGSEAPILAHDLRAISPSGETATKLCEALFGLCPTPPVDPFTIPFPKPPPQHPKIFTSLGRPTFQIVHTSDVHVDRDYTVGSEANCTKPICCRNFASETGPPTVPAPPNGNINCDSPPILLHGMLTAAHNVEPSQFMIFTGDVAERVTWLVDQPDVTTDLVDYNQNLTSTYRRTVYPSLGNHDVAPVNLFPRNDQANISSAQWVFDTQAAGWEQWIHASGAAEVRHQSGAYAITVPGERLRIIAVNTQYWYKQNFWMYDVEDMPWDPNGILSFLIQALQATEDAGDRAYIIGHIPPGVLDTFADQSNYYNQIVQRYKNTIAAQFFGHTHNDQFQIAYSNFTDQTAETADSIVFIGPSLTPSNGNPAFRIYDIDPDTYEVMDMREFFTNMTAPNFQQGTPQFELLYSARESYGRFVPVGPRDSLNPAFWHKLTEVFASNTTVGDEAFALYNERVRRGMGVTPCTGACQTQTICDLRAARAENNCDSRSKGIQFRRSQEYTAVERDDEEPACERSLGTLFRKFHLNREALRLRK